MFASGILPSLPSAYPIAPAYFACRHHFRSSYEHQRRRRPSFLSCHTDTLNPCTMGGLQVVLASSLNDSRSRFPPHYAERVTYALGRF